jgi:prolyl-tRNA editing enzyme YbaK/EbsC (Cys-tRNA(Pro) deacylase)
VGCEQKGEDSGQAHAHESAGGEGILYRIHAHARTQLTAEGVAGQLGVLLAQVLKAMNVACSDHSFVLVVVPGDKRSSLKSPQLCAG